ncbi:histidine kinase [Salinarimonas sp.]|uniref:histidine kinase n=1 Tax=Salinarimonas sp. TaxID=2766526 RepID=UPI00391BDD40
MADYYPLIARAVQGLADPAPAMRGAVYDRARAALIDQLRALDPPLSEADIDRESEALESAIARVEADYMQPEAALDEPAFEPRDPVPPAPERASSFADPAPRYEPEPRYQAEPRYEPEPPPAPVSTFQPAYLRKANAAPREEAAQDRPPRGEEASGFSLPDQRRRPALDEVAAAPAPAEPPRARPRVESRQRKSGSGATARVAIIAAALVVVVGAIAGTAYSLRETPAEVVARASAPATTAAPADEGKIAERIGGAPADATAAPTVVASAPAAQAPAQELGGGSAAAIPVAQRAVLYEEDPVNPGGEPRAAAGRAVWQLTSGGQGEPAVRATVEIPDQNLRLEMVIRRNLDPTLPASHTIDLTFATGDIESRRVRDIGLLQLKDTETIRGAPVAGLPVPVRDNLFLIGLSNLPRDVERNAQLLTGRNWIDLPIRLASGQRAILSFEKGNAGSQAMAEAFERWGAVRTSGN